MSKNVVKPGDAKSTECHVELNTESAGDVKDGELSIIMQSDAAHTKSVAKSRSANAAAFELEGAPPGNANLSKNVVRPGDAKSTECHVELNTESVGDVKDGELSIIMQSDAAHTKSVAMSRSANAIFELEGAPPSRKWERPLEGAPPPRKWERPLEVMSRKWESPSDVFSVDGDKLRRPKFILFCTQHIFHS